MSQPKVVEFSAGFMNNLAERVIRFGEVVSDFSIARTGLLPTGLISNSDVTGRVYLLSGAVPSDATYSNTDDFASSKLVMFDAARGDFQTSQVVNVNPAVLNTTYLPASASGTCTHFIWTCCKAYFNNAVESRPIYQHIIGTVGLKGSGADLELDDVNVVAGKQYRVLNFRVQFPSTWTY